MKTTAEYRDGVLILKDPITPKASILHIEIPDEELLAAEPTKAAREAEPEWEDWQLQAIERMPALEEVWRLIRTPPLEAYEDKQLSQEQLDRIEAFELRDQS